MTDARTVIAKAVEDWFLNPHDEYVEGASSRIIAALSAAGLVIVQQKELDELREKANAS